MWPPPTLAARSQRASDNRNDLRAAAYSWSLTCSSRPRARPRFDWWGARKPLRIGPQTRVDRILSPPQRIDVGAIGGDAGRHLGTFGDGAVAGNQDIDVPGGLSQPVECRRVGVHLIGAARVEERDQDIGEHVAGEQDAKVREQDRSVADGLRLMLDDLARHASAVLGQRRDEPDQLEKDARGALRRQRLRPLAGFTGSVGAGRVA